MNKFFKKLIVVSMVFALALSLTACGVNINSVGLPTELTLDKGAAQLLAVEFGAEDEATEEKIAEAASKLTLVWTSSDEAVVTVDETGLVTAVDAGEADVTVSIKDGNIQSVCHVTVQIPLTALKVDESADLVINAADSLELKPELTPADATGVGLSFESSDEAVATVDASGKVSAVANGECEITVAATSCDGIEFTKKVAVKVDTAPTGISAEDISVTIGGTAAVKTTVEGENITVGNELTYTSKDESIATVDENGKVSSVAVGSTQITVSNSVGQSVDITVTVKQIVCAYCGQEGHGSNNCEKKRADEAAAAAAAQAAAAAAAQQQAVGGGGNPGENPGGNPSGNPGGLFEVIPGGGQTIPGGGAGDSPSGANGAGSDVPDL